MEVALLSTGTVMVTQTVRMDQMRKIAVSNKNVEDLIRRNKLTIKQSGQPNIERESEGSN